MISTIPVGDGPNDIAFSIVYPSIIYVLDTIKPGVQHSTVSVIDGSADKVAAGVTFNIHPPEYWIPLYGIIVSTIVGWSIPSIIGWIKSKTRIRRVNQYHKRIHSLSTDNKKLYENDKVLDTLKTDIKNAYAEGKISEQHYSNLKDETSILYERAYKYKIDSLNSKAGGENNRIELDEIKNAITDAYAEGKIIEQHFNLLKEKITNFSDTGQTNYSSHQREYKRSPI